MEGTLFLISGHSGGGKTTIMRHVLNNEIVSFTTRDRRIGEKEGIDYIYINKEKYFELFNSNGLIEYTEYAGNYYGITKEELETKLLVGNAFAIVDCPGMEQLKKIYNKCVSIFIYTSFDDAKRQMETRGESEEIIEKRLRTYQKEMENRVYYDYVIRNNHGKLDETINMVRSIINAN